MRREWVFRENKNGALLTLLAALALLVITGTVHIAHAVVVTPPLASDSSLIARFSFENYYTVKYNFENSLEGWSFYETHEYNPVPSYSFIDSPWGTGKALKLTASKCYAYGEIYKRFSDPIYRIKFDHKLYVGLYGGSGKVYRDSVLLADIFTSDGPTVVYPRASGTIKIRADPLCSRSTLIIDNLEVSYYNRIVDDTGRNHIAVLNTPEMRTIGRYGYGLKFTGSEYVSISDASDLHFSGSSKFTITGSFMLTSLPSEVGNSMVLVSKANDFLIRVETDNKLYFRVYNGENWEPKTSAAHPLQKNVWYTFVAVYDAGKLHLYVNGQLYGESTNTKGSYTTNPIYLGKGVGGNLIGYLDEFRIYSRALSASEALAMSEAASITVYDEKSGGVIIANVDVTFPDGQTITMQTDSVVKRAILFHNDVTAYGNAAFKVYENNNYYPRYIFKTISNTGTLDFNAYLPLKSEAVLVTFQVKDLANLFPAKTSYITLRTSTELENRFLNPDKTASCYFLKGVQYDVYLNNGEIEKFAGSYTVDSPQTIVIDLGSPNLKPSISAPPSVNYPNSVQIDLTVVNNGNLETFSTTTLVLKVNGQVISQNDIPILSAGQSQSYSIMWTPTEIGTFTISAEVDPSNNVGESDETDNTAQATITVYGIDLTIPSAPSFSSPILYGGSNTATVRVQNLGNTQASNVKISLKIDGQEVGSAITTISAGSAADVPVTWTPSTVGATQIEIEVDPDNTLLELDEGNNKYTAQVVVNYIDLAIASVDLPAGSLSPENTYTFDVRITNLGDYVSQQTTIELKENGVSKDTQSVPSLDPGSTTLVRLTWTPLEIGDYTITIVVDPLKAIPEQVEDNNVYSATFTVTMANLKIVSVNAPKEVAAGNTTTITVNVSNIGNLDVPSTDLTLLENGETVTYKTISVDANEMKTIDLSYTPSKSGNVQLDICVDYTHTIQELREDDNCYSALITIYAPDLVIGFESPSSVEYSPAGVTVQLRVTNQGNYDAGPFYVLLDAQGIGTITKRVDGLKAGNSTILDMQVQLPLGPTILVATVDSNDEVHESNEDNNVVTKTFVVSGVDLAITSIEIPDSIKLGETAEIIVHVSNEGTSPVNNYTATLKVDGVEIDRKNSSIDMVLFTYTPNKTGTFLLQVEVNPIEKADANKDNNIASTTLKVTAPDLTLSVYAPDKVDALKTFTITVTIRNNGDVEARDFSLRAIYGDQIQTKTDISCNPGQSSTYYLTFTALTDKTHLLVMVDPENVINETIEDNNEINITIDVRKPDLRLSLKTPSQALIDNRQTIQIDVYNAGEIASSGQLIVKIEDTTVLSRTVSVEPSKVSTVSVYYTPKKSDYSYGSSFTVQAEITNEFGTYNTSSMVRVVAPDLTIDYIRVPYEVVLGKETYITVSIVNRGDYEAKEFNVKLTANGNTIGTVAISSLAPYSSTSRTFRWTPEALGTYTFEAIVDPENKVKEWDETNNKQTQTAVRAPDLVIENVTVNETEFYVFSPYDVIVRIANKGTAAADNVVLEMNDGKSTKTVTIPRIDSGNSTEVKMVFAPTTNGTINVNFTVDPADTIMETNDDNNQYFMEFFVKMPDSEVNITNADLPPELKERATTTLSWSLFAGYIMSAGAIIYGASQFMSTGGEIGRKYIILGALGALILTALNPGIAALKP